MVAYASNTSTGEMKIGGPEVQDHAQPNTKFKVNLGYMRSSLKICFLGVSRIHYPIGGTKVCLCRRNKSYVM